LIHSLSAGIVAEKLAYLAGYDSTMRDIAFYLALTHDIHQKLIEDGLSTMKTAKQYLREKLDEIRKHDYYRYIEDAIEIDACGKNKQIRGLDQGISLICHVADMIHGSLEGIELLYWLKERVKELNRNLTVRFYSVLIPQVIGRSFMIKRIYDKHIREKDHLALASPWGLFAIGYEDELPEVLEVSWDDLRIEKGKELIEYEKIKGSENSKASSVTINNIKLTTDELRKGLWSRFARMFYDKNSLNDNPSYPVFPEDIRTLFVNIKFTDVEFRDISRENIHKCILCGLPHLKDQSLNINMFGKIAGVDVTIEKWNKFIKLASKVRGEDQWGHKLGLCPLCTVEAIAMRESKFSGSVNGVLSISISKPTPISLLEYFGRVLVESKYLNTPIVGEGSLERVVLDYSSATAATNDVSEPIIKNLFEHNSNTGVFTRIGKLISWGIYPIKFLSSLDTTVVDRPALTPYNFPILDFPVTSKEYGNLLPWIGELLKTVGNLETNKGIRYLNFKPKHAPLALLTINKEIYDEVFFSLSSVGVKT